MVLLFWYCLLLFHTVKCTLTELTTKSFSTLWKSMVFFICTCKGILCALCLRVSCKCFECKLSVLFGVTVYHSGSFSTPSLPFSTVYSVWQVSVSLSCVEAYVWVARIYQPWEQSPFRSWLPIVGAPCGSLLHVLEFTKYVFNKL